MSMRRALTGPLSFGLSKAIASPEGVGVPAWVLSGAALDLDFAEVQGYNSLDRSKLTPDSILTYTNPSAKMVYGSDGVLGYAPHNLCFQSEAFSTSPWADTLGGTGVAPTVTADAGNDPNGNPTADRIQFSLAGGTATTDISRRRQSITVIATPHTFSVYLRSYDGSSTYNMHLTDPSGATRNIVVTGSWQRFEVSATATGSATTYAVGLRGGQIPANSNTADVLAWGAQLNAGSSALTYIPTTTAAVYSLPIDHDPVTFDPLGVLIEEQRTNLLLQSANFTTTWAIGGNSVTADQIVAPDGTMTADMLTMVASSAVYQSVTVVASTAYVFTFWVKRGTRTQLQYRIYDNSNAANIIAATSYYSQTSSSVWTRITVAFTTPIGCTSVRCYVDDSADGATGTLYPWGAQLEAGAFPTSYIPTVASQVTRAADQVSIPTSAFAYNTVEGTCVTDQDANFDVAAFVRVPSIFTDGASNYVRPYLYPNRGGLSIITGGVPQCDIGGGGEALTTGTAFKLATAWATNDVAKVVNGLTVGTDTSVSIPTGISSLRIGSSGNNVNVISGHIKRLTYFPTRKSDAELQALST